MSEVQDDPSNCVGADQTAQQIETYWRERGFSNVKAWTEYYPGAYSKGRETGIWGVRTNLVNGLPPK